MTQSATSNAPKIWVLGEALMDCDAEPNGSLRPYMGGSPFNLARAAALRVGAQAQVGFLAPLSNDQFGDQMRAQFALDGVHSLLMASPLPTSLAVVQLHAGQPSYGFYREGIADRDYTVDAILARLQSESPGVLHTGSLFLLPPEQAKVAAILRTAKTWGWTISVDVNLRPKLAADLPAYVTAVKQIAAMADWLKASDEDLALLGVGSPRRENAESLARQLRTALGQLPSQPPPSRQALTFGGAGAWLEVDGQAAYADVPAVQVVDTVGAGDTFWGNCLGAWVTQGTRDVADTLREAMCAAAINCGRPGCQPPRHEEVLAKMQK